MPLNPEIDLEAEVDYACREIVSTIENARALDEPIEVNAIIEAVHDLVMAIIQSINPDPRA